MARAGAGKANLPTISDVAALAGVSRAVVSRALSGQERPVSEDKRQRVEAAAAQLGYRPNVLARGLSTQSLDLVAVVVNHIHDLSDLELFDRLLTAIQDLGKQMILVRIASEDDAISVSRRGIAYHVDAALVFSDFVDAQAARRLFRSDLVIMLNGRQDENSPAVLADEAKGIEEAIADAAGKSIRTAALVTGRMTSPNETRRVSLYKAAFARAGIGLTREVQGDYSYASGRAAAALIAADDWPDAVFCTSDAMAMGLLDVRRADFPHNRAGKFRLYGFDNLNLLDMAAYPIATIGFDKADYVARIIHILREGGKTPGAPSTLSIVASYFVPGATAW